MTLEFKPSAEFNDFLNDCRTLNFDYVAEGPNNGFTNDLNNLEVTPYATGYTQEHNEIIREGNSILIGNTNTEYGAEIYDKNNFSHKINTNAKGRWLDIADDGYETTVQLVVSGIQNEIEARFMK